MSTDTEITWAPSKDAWDALLQSIRQVADVNGSQAEEIDKLRSDVAQIADLKRVHADYHEDLRAEHEQAIADLGERLAARLCDLESFKAQAYTQVEILTAQVQELREAQKANDTDRYVELRRALLVIGLTPLVARRRFSQIADPDDVFAWDQSEWNEVCAEFFTLYGHLIVDGKPLWASPPKPPSPETRALIAECLLTAPEA